MASSLPIGRAQQRVAVGEGASAAQTALLPITVIIPTKDEELNLPDALASVRWAQEVVVVDSHSTDRTGAIAAESGATVVQFDYQHGSDKKKNWILAAYSFVTEWVLILDADERVPEALRQEIATAIQRDGVDGYYLDRQFIFLGRDLRHCHRPDWNLRLFKHRVGRYEHLVSTDLTTGDNEVHEHLILQGKAGYLHYPLLHQDWRSLHFWFDRHNRYATWEALVYRQFRQEPLDLNPLHYLNGAPVWRKRLLKRLWVRLPGHSFVRFFLLYVLKRGFLDGREGFLYCVLMVIYEVMISAKLYELEKVERCSSSNPAVSPETYRQIRS